ncbi:hypothetical protein ALC53_05348, partial [Atta colombica]
EVARRFCASSFRDPSPEETVAEKVPESLSDPEGLNNGEVFLAVFLAEDLNTCAYSEYYRWSIMDIYPYSLLSFDVFFPGNTRPDSVARAGTLTYIHIYVSKPMSTTVDRAIVRSSATRPGNRAARFNIFEIVELRPQHRRTVGPVALLCAVVSVPSSRSNQIAMVVVRANARQMLLAER